MIMPALLIGCRPVKAVLMPDYPRAETYINGSLLRTSHQVHLHQGLNP